MKDYIEIQIGHSVYKVRDQDDIAEAIRSIVIYHQGDLSTLVINPIYDEWIEWNNSREKLANYFNNAPEDVADEVIEAKWKEYRELALTEPTKYIKKK